MLGIFSSSVVSPPEELVAAGSRTPSPKTTAGKLLNRFVENKASAVSLQVGEHVQLAYTHHNESPWHPRSFAVKDEIFCLFEGALDNLGSLRQQYGLAKSANEVVLVIEAYKALRDRAPYPANRVVCHLSGSFAFIVFDKSTSTLFVASSAPLNGGPGRYFNPLHSNKMDQNKQGEAAEGGNIGHPAHGKNQEEQSNPMIAPTNPPKKKSLEEQLNDFWAAQREEAKMTTNFKTHSLPLSRIKKIIKTDKDVKMISAETPVVFAKACEMFIKELTIRAWANTEARKGKILSQRDLVSAISQTASFDFLDDIMPKDAGLPRTSIASTENAYLNMPPQQNVAGLPYDAPTMAFPNLNHHAPN
ncbi:hypothetical protein JHK87_036789 [Glycine soja]|nr:hypothetical protein JHK87_036789 [Glycine soja]